MAAAKHEGVCNPCVVVEPQRALLVVEDYPPLATVIAIALRRELQRPVVRVGSIQRALAEEVVSFEVACIDLELPDGDGLQLATELRDAGVAHVVFFTASRDEQKLATARELGPVVDKTAGVDELVLVIRESLAQAEEAVQLAAGGEAQPPSTPRRNQSGMRRRVR